MRISTSSHSQSVLRPRALFCGQQPSPRRLPERFCARPCSAVPSRDESTTPRRGVVGWPDQTARCLDLGSSDLLPAYHQLVASSFAFGATFFFSSRHLSTLFYLEIPGGTWGAGKDVIEAPETSRICVCCRIQGLSVWSFAAGKKNHNARRGNWSREHLLPGRPPRPRDPRHLQPLRLLPHWTQRLSLPLSAVSALALPVWRCSPCKDFLWTGATAGLAVPAAPPPRRHLRTLSRLLLLKFSHKSHSLSQSHSSLLQTRIVVARFLDPPCFPRGPDVGLSPEQSGPVDS